jgi:methylmalonyl-CoA mutase
MADFGKRSRQDWEQLATRENRGKQPDSLTWQTPEGIPVRPLYTAEDLAGLKHLDNLPGFAPFVRGPRATMYAGRPWTVRQYAGFSTAEESNALLPQQPRCRPEGPLDRLRSANASRL